MNRRALAAVHLLGCVLAAPPVAAQSAAPVSLFGGATAPPLEPVDFSAAMRDSSEQAQRALRESRLHESWYGWQTLTVDAASVGVLLAGAAMVTTRSASIDAGPPPAPLAFATAAVAIYALGPPLVHVAHGEFAHALWSSLVRNALPLAGVGLGWLAGGRQLWPAAGGMDLTAGGLAGAAAAMTVDAGVLAWQRWSATPTVALFDASARFE